MNFKEIAEIIALREEAESSPNPDSSYFIGVKDEHIDGMENPLWSVINSLIPPMLPWRKLSGQERTQIKRVANLLIEKRIPYFVYANYLIRFGKEKLKQKPLMITKIKDKKDGATTILSDFVSLIEYLVKTYQENPAVIKLVDILYDKHSSAYSLGIYKYIYSADLIKSFLANGNSPGLVTRYIEASNTIDGFFKALGEITHTTIDLSKGVAMPVMNLKLLQREIRVRTVEDVGTPNPALDKYFKLKGKLNVQGLKLLGIK